MNLPNKLTMLRVILIIPFVVVMMLEDIIPYARYIGCAIFAIASLTDLLDGKIARKYNLVTNFGKFADPLADKLLVAAALVIFAYTHQLQAWFVIVILSREFIISGFRLVAVEQGVVIAAGWFGKIKTVLQMVMIILLLLNIETLSLITLAISYAALVMTVFSLVEYLVKNWHIMKGEM